MLAGRPAIQRVAVIVGNIGMAVIGFRQMVLNLIVKVCDLIVGYLKTLLSF